MSLKSCSGSSASNNPAAPAEPKAATPVASPSKDNALTKPHSHGAQAEPHKSAMGRRAPSAKDEDFWAEGAPAASSNAQPKAKPIQATSANYEPLLTPAHPESKPKAVDRTTFGLRLGEPSSLSPCTPHGSPTTTCLETPNPKRTGPGSHVNYPAGFASQPVVLAPERCPSWLKGEGCRITLAVRDGKVHGTSLATASDPENQRLIVQQLSEKYDQKPLSTATGSCLRAKSSQIVTNASVHIWDLDGMRVTLSPLPTDCDRSTLSVELEALQRARLDASAPPATEPRM